MYIQSLTISTPSKILREIVFHKGLNLIVDETPETNTNTGNNVGKTTVLRLIDFCLGKSPNAIYQDPEHKREIYQLVKEFLINNKVIVTLILVDDLDSPTRQVEISRNFLTRKESLCMINNTKVSKAEFEVALEEAIFPDISVKKPTFRQIISHNIRYENSRLDNTLRTLDAYTREDEYETLYLFLFGCEYNDGNRRQELLTNIQSEQKFKRRLEKQETKSAYKSALDIIKGDIEKLMKKKSELNINPELEADLQALDEIKLNINKISTDITNLYLRRDIINEVQEDFRTQKFNEDISQLRLIYQQAKALAPNLQKTFEELVQYHNQMLDKKVKFMIEELPVLNSNIQSEKAELNRLLSIEKVLSEKVARSNTFEDLGAIICELNELYQRKGNYESIIEQIDAVDEALKQLNDELRSIDKELFADDFKNNIDAQLSKFNKIFADISEQLYGERYAIKCDVITGKDKTVYKFATIDTNFSSGKKQGEISCFDIAYIKFAEQENIPCLHFILNDKKELMHGNQLLKLADIVEKENIQFVASILEDKLPEPLKNERYYIVKLSQNNKLFRIE